MKFKPQDELVVLVSSIISKQAESGQSSLHSAAGVTADEDSSPSHNLAAAPQSGVSRVVKHPNRSCNYCKKIGHYERQCLRKKHHAQTQQQSKPRVEGTFPSVRPKTFFSPTWERIAKTVPQQQSSDYTFASRSQGAHAAPGRQLLFCALHDQCNHDTEHCNSLKAMREGRQVRRADETYPSREVARRHKRFPS